ncbi:MAG: S1C family serine protease [Steroidobacteraceae bacterium]
MTLRKLGLGLVFLAGAIIGGLALAFLVVYFRPDLLVRTRIVAPPATAPLTMLPPAGTSPAAEVDAPPDARPAAVSMRSFAQAVQRAAPAVVNIYTARLVTEQVQPNSFEQLFNGPRTEQHVQRALGSGVIIDDAGHIVTNNHVIANAAIIKVRLADGRSADARVVGRDPDTDLALLVIKLAKLPVMTLGRSDRLQVGDEVLAIGNPLGLQQSVTHGIVSATDRKQLGLATFENFIQTDAAINEGNSGGALIDADGELVGINTAVIAKNSDPSGVEGIGFAIPVNLARGVIREIIEHGHVVRGWSGIYADDFTDDQAAYYRLPHGGVVITGLYANGPAANAGLRVGDILLAVNGRSLRNAQDALTQVASEKPGVTVKLRMQRGAEVREVECKVVQRPKEV